MAPPQFSSAATAPAPGTQSATPSVADTPLERAKAQVSTLPAETLGATLEVLADLKKGDAAKAALAWIDPVKGEKPSMASSIVGPAGAEFDAPVNGQMAVTQNLVAGAAAGGADGGLAIPAVALLAREQGMLGGLTAVHTKNANAEENLKQFFDANLAPGAGQQVINELRNDDTANKTVGAGVGTAAFNPFAGGMIAGAQAKKVQLETALAAQFDQAIAHATDPGTVSMIRGGETPKETPSSSASLPSKTTKDPQPAANVQVAAVGGSR